MNDNSSLLRQTQQTKLQQRLNPQQVQFGRLLEMSTPELEDEIRRELDENPALEELRRDEDYPENDFNETAEQLQMADFSDDDIPSYRLESNNYSPDDSYYTPTAVSEDDNTLIRSLTSQLSEYDLSDTDRRIADFIIGSIDDNGYITRSLPSIADDLAIMEGIYVDTDRVRKVFDTVRSLDPAGICAVDLRDCLLLQIDRLTASLPVRIAHEIIADYFDLFSKKHFDKIISQLGIDSRSLGEALDLIKTLNPKPGASLQSGGTEDRMRHITPDFSVDYDDRNDTFHVSLLNRTPELGIESSFRIDENAKKEKSESRRDREADSFIRKRYDDATGFIRMLKMRSETLMAVMRAIVEMQHPFFAGGDKSTLRPMILKDVAARTGLDISVISRAATSKYVLCEHGIYPLKFFFSERPKTDTDTSSHEILQAISSIIENEDKSHPLSDEAIRSELTAKGYDIARRTVAKYRERLGLPVGRLRKQLDI